MEKLQHMARVTNLRKLTFLLFLRGSSADKSRVLSFILASWGLAWLRSSLVKVWTVVLEMPAALRALSGHCVRLVGAGGEGWHSLENVLMPGGPVFISDLCLASEYCCTNARLLILGFTVIWYCLDFGSLPFPEGEM